MLLGLCTNQQVKITDHISLYVYKSLELFNKRHLPLKIYNLTGIFYWFVTESGPLCSDNLTPSTTRIGSFSL